MQMISQLLTYETMRNLQSRLDGLLVTVTFFAAYTPNGEPIEGYQIDMETAAEIIHSSTTLNTFNA